MINRRELKAAWGCLLFTDSLLHQKSQQESASGGKVTPMNQHSLSSSEKEVEPVIFHFILHINVGTSCQLNSFKLKNKDENCLRQ